MKVEKELKDLLIRFHLKAEMDVIILNQSHVIDFVGETNICVDYLNKSISNELKDFIKQISDLKVLNDYLIAITEEVPIDFQSEAIYHFKETNHTIIFLKRDENMGEDDILLIRSLLYLVEKFFT